MRIGEDDEVVYLDEKKQLRKKDVEAEIIWIDKETEYSGLRKAKLRLYSSILCLTEAKIFQSRSKRGNLKARLF